MCGTWGEGGLKTIPVGCHWGREWCTARPAQPKRTKWNHQVLKCHLTRCMVPKRHKLLLGGIPHWLIFVFSATIRLFLFRILDLALRSLSRNKKRFSLKTISMQKSKI